MTDRISDISENALEQIDVIAKTSKKTNPLVAIRCITYNHEPYIRDALEGFVMQKTDFPFVAIVHDDASTDGTAAIIREYAEKYPDIIKPIYETENQYSKRDGSLGRIMNRASEATGAKYIALCEGDDYWIDPLKLQKQVDFLENNPNYSMICGRVKRLDQNTNTIVDEWGYKVESFDNLLIDNCISTPSVMMRAECYARYIKEINPSQYKWKLGDYPIWLFMAGIGNIKFSEEITTVYRIIPNSASHFNDYLKMIEFAISTSDIQSVLGNYFKAKPKIKHLNIVRKYISELQKAVLTNDCISVKKYRLLLVKNIMNRYTTNKLRIKMLFLFLSPYKATKVFEKRAMLLK